MPQGNLPTPADIDALLLSLVSNPELMPDHEPAFTLAAFQDSEEWHKVILAIMESAAGTQVNIVELMTKVVEIGFGLGRRWEAKQHPADLQKQPSIDNEGTIDWAGTTT